MIMARPEKPPVMRLAGSKTDATAKAIRAVPMVMSRMSRNFIFLVTVIFLIPFQYDLSTIQTIIGSKKKQGGTAGYFFVNYA